MPDNVPLGAFSGSDATDRLRVVIEEFSETANKQTGRLICLTWALVALTVVLVIGLIVQIVIVLD